MMFQFMNIIVVICLAVADGYFLVFSPGHLHAYDPAKQQGYPIPNSIFPKSWGHPLPITGNGYSLIYVDNPSHRLLFNACNMSVIDFSSREDTEVSSFDYMPNLYASGDGFRASTSPSSPNELLVESYQDETFSVVFPLSSNVQSLLWADRSSCRLYDAQNTPTVNPSSTAAISPAILRALSGNSSCTGCEGGRSTSGCPDPGKCGHLPLNTNCVNCMDGMKMPDCQKPEECGFEPEAMCMGCQDGKSTPMCEWPQRCNHTATANCSKCENRKSTPTCPKPENCGFAPVPNCTMCMGGMSMPNCQWPSHCGQQAIPDCARCDSGKWTKSCPEPGDCGLEKATSGWPCQDCMAGMAMPNCPFPDKCSDSCTMAMTFGMSQDVCILFESWHIHTSEQYILAVIFLTAASVLREWCTVMRALRARKKNDKNAGCGTFFVDALWYGFSLVLAYSLMLVVMSYQTGLFITVIVGSTFGQFIMNWYFKTQSMELSPIN